MIPTSLAIFYEVAQFLNGKILVERKKYSLFDALKNSSVAHDTPSQPYTCVRRMYYSQLGTSLRFYSEVSVVYTLL
jgi:hypothetical protein